MTWRRLVLSRPPPDDARIGDVVYGISQRRVKNFEEFNRLLAQPQGGRLGLLVRRGRADFYVAMDLAAGVPKASPPPRDTLLRI